MSALIAMDTQEEGKRLISCPPCVWIECCGHAEQPEALIFVSPDSAMDTQKEKGRPISCRQQQRWTRSKRGRARYRVRSVQIKYSFNFFSICLISSGTSADSTENRISLPTYNPFFSYISSFLSDFEAYSTSLTTPKCSQ